MHVGILLNWLIHPSVVLFWHLHFGFFGGLPYPCLVDLRRLHLSNLCVKLQFLIPKSVLYPEPD